MARSSAFSGGFDEATVRTAILETMAMGIPEDPTERLTFMWRRVQVFSPDDPAGSPYDWTAPPLIDNPGNPALPDTGNREQSLQVPYALEFSARAASGAATSLGDIDTSRVVVTMLDTDFDKIRTADYAVIGDTTYRILFDAPPIGLFGMTVWQLYLEAEDSV